MTSGTISDKRKLRSTDNLVAVFLRTHLFAQYKSCVSLEDWEETEFEIFEESKTHK